MKTVSQKEIENRIIEKFPGQPFEIIEYTKVTKPFTIKCLQCGEVKTYSNCSNYLGSSRKGLCSCYNENNNLARHNNNKKKILEMCQNSSLYNFVSFGYDDIEKKYLVTVECNNCKQEYTKSWQSFFVNDECYYCRNKQMMNTQAFKSLLSKEYTLLSEYNGAEGKITVRHNICGFIWKPRAHGFLNYKGCPKCNRKKSKGEQKVEEFLINNKIPYQTERTFDWQSNQNRRYDFYLPEQNLLIEYMGEQHYKPNTFFDISLEHQQEIDKEKKEEALANNFNYLAIPYTEFLRVDEILEKVISSTTSLHGVDLSESKRGTS